MVTPNDHQLPRDRVIRLVLDASRAHYHNDRRGAHQRYQEVPEFKALVGKTHRPSHGVRIHGDVHCGLLYRHRAILERDDEVSDVLRVPDDVGDHTGTAAVLEIHLPR